MPCEPDADWTTKFIWLYVCEKCQVIEMYNRLLKMMLENEMGAEEVFQRYSTSAEIQSRYIFMEV